jgi:hypothetical protein
MNDSHEVISAFLDDEPFDSAVLLEALSDPVGRDLLVDLIALRHVTQADRENAHASNHHEPWPASLRALAAVAAILVALVGGYIAGAGRSVVSNSAAPRATRVVEAPAWQDVPPRRMP